MNPFNLLEKTILVTGASSGIGRATAISCAQMGAKLVLSGRNESRLQQTYTALEGQGHAYYMADLTKEDEIKALVNSLKPLDGVVHCAGINKKMLVAGLTENIITTVMQTNFVSSVLLSRYLLKGKKLNPEASVVFISSISVDYPAIGNAIYCASKGAIQSFSKVMALETADAKIRVNSIEPGMIATEWLEKTDMTEEQMQQVISKYPFKRFGTPEEVAYAAVYLLSDTTKWMTGSVIKLDGGLTLI
jgi:NAD(P)-dependent dehydrogenase (short-subunit alcohol dehydrogenase family)